MKLYSCVRCVFVLISVVCCVHSSNALVADESGQRQDKADTVRVKELKEIVISADRVVHKEDHDVLFLSKDSRRFGTNALDAVSTMPEFKTEFNSKSLVTFDQRSVYILINGVPSSAVELRGYKGDDIKNVEYYSEAPAKYMIFTSGPVINVNVRRRYDKFYSAYVDATNSVNVAFGDNQVELMCADSLNQFRLSYYNSYRSIGGIQKRGVFHYGADDEVKLRCDDASYYGFLQQVQGSYQRSWGKHLLNARLIYKWNPGDEREDQVAEMVNGGTMASGLGSTYLKKHSEALTLDVFYSYRFSNTRNLALNVVNTFSRASSHKVMSRVMDEPYSALGFEAVNGVDNRTYTLIANAIFTSAMLGGKYSAGARYAYQRLRQRSAGEEYVPVTNNVSFYNSLSWKVRNVRLTPSVGLYMNDYSQGRERSTDVFPRMMLYTDWWGKGRLKGCSVQLTLRMDMKSPGSGSLTPSATNIDGRFVSVGNPDLKSYMQGSVKLALLYNAPDRRKSIRLVSTLMYANRPNANVLYGDDGVMYSQLRKIDSRVASYTGLYATYKPVRWLELSPYASLEYFGYTTPGNKVRYKYVRYGGSVVFAWDKARIGLYANAPVKERAGDVFTRNSVQLAAVSQVNVRNCTIGLEWHFSGRNDYEHGASGEFFYHQRKDWNRLNNLVQLCFTWSFSKGKLRRQPSRTINDGSDDDGLVDANTPKMSK